MDDQCRRRLEEVRQWFESLPEGVAEMETSELQEQGVLVVGIRPILNPHATKFWLHFLDGEFHVGTEGGGRFPEVPCSDSAVDYCRGIVVGDLTLTEYHRKGRVVQLRTDLRREGETETFVKSGCYGCLTAPLQWLLRREKHRTHYPAYYDLVPRQSQPAEAVLVVPPILAWEGGLTSFPNVRDAEGYIEVPDVDDHIIYDSQGRLLKAKAGDRKKDGARVSLECVEPEPVHAAELRRKLLDRQVYLSGSQEWLRHASLEQLVAEALTFSWA